MGQGRRTISKAAGEDRLQPGPNVGTDARAARGKERLVEPIDEDRSVFSEAAKERSPSMDWWAKGGERELREFEPAPNRKSARVNLSDERVLYRGIPQLSTSRKKTCDTMMLAACAVSNNGLGGTLALGH